MALPLLVAAGMATAAIPAEPCTPPLAVPEEVEAWRRTVYAPATKVLPPPPPEAAAFRAAYAEARKTDWPDLCRYRADNARVATLPHAERDVVFMGDSITEGWGYVEPAIYTRGWISRGISGQTTQQMLLRFPADVLALRPRVVHIMAGTNDVAGNTGPVALDTTVGDIAAMVTLAKAAGIRVVLAATPPSAGFNWKTEIKPAPVIAELNRQLRALAARERVTFADYGTVLATPEGALRPEMTFDGTHPNAAGYAAIKPLVVKAIAAARRL